MLQNLLTSTLPEGGQIVTVPESVLYALIGYLMVFAGIILLIAIVWIVGKVISSNKPAPKTEKPVKENVEIVSIPNKEELDEETVAVITAALMAYYQENKPYCGFIVKRIKRI